MSPAPTLQGLVGYSQVKLLAEKQLGNLPGSLFLYSLQLIYLLVVPDSFNYIIKHLDSEGIAVSSYCQMPL